VVVEIKATAFSPTLVTVPNKPVLLYCVDKEFDGTKDVSDPEPLSLSNDVFGAVFPPVRTSVPLMMSDDVIVPVKEAVPFEFKLTVGVPPLL
ncbi:MAG: hypothetical protein EBV69_10625, partial [Oxalobacteraceae bacterium]|nr:hypothetical protein [Oxalobacteraceae bacterium]